MSRLSEHLSVLEHALEQCRKGKGSGLQEAGRALQLMRQDIDALARQSAELATLYEVSRELNAIRSLNRLLEFIMDRAIVLAQAERGFLVLWNAERDDFEVAVARQFAAGEVDDAQVELSHGLIRRVMASREPIITTNAQEDPRFRASQSIIAYQIRSVLAVPLVSQEELVGAIYLDTRLSSRLFTPDDLKLVSGLADQAATALSMARLNESLQAKNRELEVALVELRAAQDELIQAERLSLVGRMASTLVHDLKNPMTTIKGFADLLGRSDLTPEARQRFSQTVSRTIDAFVGMTQEVLDYVRGTEAALDLQPIEVEQFVQDICAFLAADFAQQNIEIKTILKYTGPVPMDRSKMWRVFVNIANNARDAMENGGVFMMTAQEHGDMIEFWLADNGPGIPRQIRDRLFEPFVTHGKQYGTGLGLAIAKKIVDDHHGTISAESRPGQGACFIIRLPRDQQIVRHNGAEPKGAEGVAGPDQGAVA